MHRFNIILMGATGYTGRATIPALYKLTKKNGRHLTWAVAGRSKEKLQKVLHDASQSLGDNNLNQIPIIVADITNELSLNKMASQGELVINVCGPFRFFGEAIVKACIANGTHHLDISGEPQFIETIQLKYSQLAEQNKSYVVSSCGFDSIPADLGVVFMQDNFRGVLHSIEAHLQTGTTNLAPKTRQGPVFNYATWVSAVNGMNDYQSLKEIRKELDKNKIKVPVGLLPKTTNRKNIFKNQLTGQWSLPFPGADTSVVRRSQQYFFEKDNKTPIKFDMYFCVDSISSVIRSLFGYVTLSTLSKSNIGKKLLLKHPKLFSFGVFSHEEPNKVEQKQSKATIFMKGSGVLDVNKNIGKQHSDVIVSRVSTIDPAYGNTGVIVTLAAITLLEEKDKLPNNGMGGVFTPAAVFSKTSLIQRLNQNGITFKILSKL